MAYRFNGVECDTFEELQRLQGSARTTSAVVKETRKKSCKGVQAEFQRSQEPQAEEREEKRCGKWWDGYQCSLPFGHSGGHS